METLHAPIAAVFDQVQVSLANHKKNSVSLAKIHVEAARNVQQLADGSLRLIGEHRFSRVFVDMLSRVLVVKKGVQPADRVVKFVGTYVTYILEKGLAPPTPSSSSDDQDVDTPVSRFISQLLKFLLKGFVAKDKNVRFRSVGVVAELVSRLGELDEDIYDKLRDALLERRRDREAVIRAQAILALAKLMDTDTDGHEGQEEENGILGYILDSLCSDASCEVRRIALANVPLTSATLPIVITRTRDVDPCIRALVFGKALRQLDPAQLTVSQRETSIRDGLGDRDDKVKAAAADMVDHWFDTVASESSGDFLHGVVRFLSLFDLTTEAGLAVASDALRSLFVTKASDVRKVVFPDTYWHGMSLEAAVFARCFIEYTSPDSAEASCSGIGLHTNRMIEDAGIPVVMAFAFFVQENCNLMLDAIEEYETLKADEDLENISDDEQDPLVLERCEEEMCRRVCILGEMLKTACCLDYTDEIGRRKMFLVIRTMIAVEYLPDSLLDLCLEVLKLTTDDREMIKITVETMVELRDSLFDNEDNSNEQPSVDFESSRMSSLNASRLGSHRRPTQELTEQEKLRADEVDLRCLTLCIAMLKRVNGKFEENSMLEGIVNDLIVPSIKRVEPNFRELGLIALGLCCLIARDMALQSFALFCTQVQHVPGSLKPKILQIVLDLLLMHSDVFFQRSKDTTDQMLSFLLQTFEENDSLDVRAVICVGLSKLMLNGVITDERVLAALVLAFVSPANSENQQLRQCLSFFIPAYCYSSYANQSRMQSIFFTVFDLVTQAYAEMEEDQDMIIPAQFCALFVDWTDPQKRASGSSSRLDNEDTHFNLAIEILKSCYDEERTSEWKAVYQILPKLHLPTTPDPGGLSCLTLLLSNLEHCSVDDAVSQKSLEKFGARAVKQYSKQLKTLRAVNYVDDPRYRAVLDLVRVQPPGISADQQSSDSEEESEVDEDSPRGRLLSPMKPATLRKARPTSEEVELDDVDAAGASVPPLSRSPSPSHSPSLSSVPPPTTISNVYQQRHARLPFKALKRLRTADQQHAKAAAKADTDSDNAHDTSDTSDSKLEPRRKTRRPHHRPRVEISRFDSQDSDF